MAYKRQSPLPLVEGGTNTQAFANVNGTVLYDGTSLATINPGSAGEVLTCFGAGNPPQFQPASGSGFFWSGGQGGQGSSSLFTYISSGAPQFNALLTLGGAGFEITNPNCPRFPVPFACTLSDLYVIIFSNNLNSSMAATININGVNTAMTITVGSGATGTFSDLVHTAMLAQGDLLGLSTGPATAAVPGNAIFGQWTIKVTPF